MFKLLTAASLAVPALVALASLPTSRALPLPTPMQNDYSDGALLAVGGGDGIELTKLFVNLAGGPGAKIVFIPTALGAPSYPEDLPEMVRLQRQLPAEVTLLHTDDPAVANTEEFCAPLRTATGVWFGGGRQWRLADAYLGTLAQEEIEAVHRRGGVIGGTSAGATILGSYLARGDSKTNTIMMGDHEEGLGLLENVAIDQHLLARNRQFDLIEVVEAHPELLGIGIDEDTGILVRGPRIEVVGKSHVAIYDHGKTTTSGGRFYFLRPGDQLDLDTRVPERSGRPLPEIVEQSWESGQ